MNCLRLDAIYFTTDSEQPVSIFVVEGEEEMNQKLEIEYATLEDVPDIMMIMETACQLTKDAKWYSKDDEEFVKRHLEEEGFTLKAMKNGEIAGFLIVRYPGDAKDNLGEYIGLDEAHKREVAHMESAAVLPKYKGLGIQRCLMLYGENILKKQSYRYLMGTAHPENTYSVNNFLKLDYEIVTEVEKYGGLPRYVFCKELDAS